MNKVFGRGKRVLWSFLCGLIILALIIVLVLRPQVVVGGCRDGGDTFLHRNRLTYTWENPCPSDNPKLTETDNLSGSLLTTVPEKYRLVAQTDTRALYVREDTAEGIFFDKTRGLGWPLAPHDRDADPIATGTQKTRLGALLSVEYLLANGSTVVYDSWNDSVKNGSFTVEDIDGGVKITFELGKKRTFQASDVPQVIARERLESFLHKLNAKDADSVKSRYRLLSLSSMSEKSRKENLEKYPQLADHDLYILKDLSSGMIETVYRFLEAAGYTASDLAADNKENNIASESTPFTCFTVSLRLTLEKDDLLAEVRAEEIKSFDGTRIRNIRVLEHFGAANWGERGYLFVPDGSGSLIYLNDYSFPSSVRELKIYGTDAGIRSEKRGDAGQPVGLPVFGAKIGKAAFLGIIEDGASRTTLRINTPGTENSYNFLSPSFLLNPSDRFDIMTDYRTGGEVMANVSAAESFSDRVAVRYCLLPEHASDYTGMATAYRTYLQHTGNLTDQTLPEGELPFYLETLGAVSKEKRLLGIAKVNTFVPLTTYQQTKAMLSSLRDGGITNLRLSMSGWSGNGLSQGVASASPIGALGGENELKSLLLWLAEKNVPCYGGAELQRIYSPNLFFNKKTNLARYMGEIYSEDIPYDPVTGFRDPSRSSAWLLTPQMVQKSAAARTKEYDTLSLSGIAIEDMANFLYADYAATHFADTEETVSSYKQTLKTTADEMGVLVKGSNSYVLSAAEAILELPISDSGYRTFHESIPFYPMVIHGYIDYSGIPLNRESDAQTAILRAIEYGASPYYQLLYQNGDQLKDSDFHGYYAADFEKYRDTAVAVYATMNAALSPAVGSPIVGHRQLAAGVYLTRYQNGYSTVVNYTNQEYSYDGINVPASGWKGVKDR